jgi:hypothetical protein
MWAGVEPLRVDGSSFSLTVACACVAVALALPPALAAGYASPHIGRKVDKFDGLAGRPHYAKGERRLPSAPVVHWVGQGLSTIVFMGGALSGGGTLSG